MKFRINPTYNYFTSFFETLPTRYDVDGNVIYKARNELRTLEYNGVLLNIKCYKRPNTINKVIYSFFRKSKARRAYENALNLLSKGFETPAPIGFMELFKNGLLTDSYFVSIQSPYSRLFREFADESDIRGREEIVSSFGELLAKYHEAGILHLDLSVGNILFEKLEDGYHFSVVDLNRMKFQTIGLKKGCKNFERLRGSSDFFKEMTASYAKARGFNKDTCYEIAYEAHLKSVAFFKRKKFTKRLLRRIPKF